MVFGRGENIICVHSGRLRFDPLSHPSSITDMVLTSSDDAFVSRLLDGVTCVFVFSPS